MLLITLTLGDAFGQTPARQTYPEDTDMRGAVEMPLNVIDHVPVIEAKINGKGPYRFQLDTGFGGMVEVNESLAKQLNLPAKGEAQSGDPSGRNPMTVRLLRADSVDVGTAHFGGVVVSESKRHLVSGFDGIIGLNLFYSLTVHLDYVNNKFRLSDGNLTPDGSLSYTIENGVPSVEIAVNGTKTKVDIDSGSPAEVSLPLSMAKTLPLKAPPVVVGRGRTADGEFEVYGSELKGDVTVGGLILKDPRLDFVSVFPSGNLGFRFLKNLIVTFDPANKRVRFERSVAMAAGSAVSSPDLSALSKTTGGKRVIDYFAAFNSGDEEKLAAFFRENISTESLKERPVERRIAFHRQVRGDFPTLTIQRIVSATDKEITVLAKSPAGDWAEFSFEFEPQASKISGFGIDQVSAPTDAAKHGPLIPAPTTRAELVTATDRLLGELAGSDAFSGVVMIANGEKPLYSKALGYADAERKASNNSETRFNLGSINKVFTRIAIGQLVKAGKLSFDDKLIKILPDYPNRAAAEKITIGQLITMKSGIGDFFNEKFMAADRSKIRTLRDYLPFFADEPLLFEPGTSNSYSNGGYLVLGLIIEKLTGRSYYDYVRDNIFKPTGMANTDSYERNDLPANTAFGYQRGAGGRVRNTDSLPGRGSSAGGGYSNAADLLRLANALRSKKLEIPDDEGRFPVTFNGLGVAGGSEGVNALFITNGLSGYTVIVLSNYDPPSAEKPGSQIRDWIKQIRD